MILQHNLCLSEVSSFIAIGKDEKGRKITLEVSPEELKALLFPTATPAEPAPAAPAVEEPELSEEQPLFVDAPVVEEPVPVTPEGRTGIFCVTADSAVIPKENGIMVKEVRFGQTDKKFRLFFPAEVLQGRNISLDPDLSFSVYYVVAKDKDGKYCQVTGMYNLPIA